MTFIVLTCPGCGRRILMDETDGLGYCMYCGLRIDASGVEGAEYLDCESAELLDIVVNGAESASHENEPWYPPMAESVQLLMEGRTREAGDSFAEALDGCDDRSAASMKDAMAEYLAQWILRTVYEGSAYDRGLMDVAPRLIIPGDSESIPSILIEAISEAVSNSVRMVDSPSEAKAMALTELHLLCDYFETEPSIANQASMVDRFVADAEVFADLADQFDEGGPDVAVKDIERMIEAAKTLGDAISESISGIPQTSLNALEAAWSSKGMSSASGPAGEALRGWNGPEEAVSGASKMYVRLYMEPLTR